MKNDPLNPAVEIECLNKMVPIIRRRVAVMRRLEKLKTENLSLIKLPKEIPDGMWATWNA